jgi:hypothetical protein
VEARSQAHCFALLETSSLALLLVDQIAAGLDRSLSSVRQHGALLLLLLLLPHTHTHTHTRTRTRTHARARAHTHKHTHVLLDITRSIAAALLSSPLLSSQQGRTFSYYSREGGLISTATCCAPLLSCTSSILYSLIYTLMHLKRPANARKETSQCTQR